ncbi:hypothetical protein GCM10029964_093120 [Kibdelosporangium lantanae]
MTSPDFDPETARLTALTALRAWARQQERQPAERAALISAAWQAGERNLRELARIADVSRTTVYEDLRSHNINPPTDRAAPRSTPKPAPLDRDQVTDLGERMAAVLLPSMIGPVTEPLAGAAWSAHQVIGAIGKLLDPELPATERAGWLDSVAGYADTIRRDAFRQWAAEATDDELAAFTLDAQMTSVEIREAAYVQAASLDLLMPDGMTNVHVTLGTAGHRDSQPEGWTQWSAGDTPLDPIDRYRHLEITSLLGSLSELIAPALPEALMGHEGD